MPCANHDSRQSYLYLYMYINIRCIRINTHTRSWTLRDESHTSHARYTDVPSIMEKTDFKSVYIYIYIPTSYCVLCTSAVSLCARIYRCILLQFFMCTYVLYTYNTHTYSTKSTIIACTILGWRATWRIKTIIIFIDHAWVLQHRAKSCECVYVCAIEFVSGLSTRVK